MAGFPDDPDDYPDEWCSRRSSTSVDVSEGDDMSICYPLDPADAGIYRKSAIYGGCGLDSLQNVPTENTPTENAPTETNPETPENHRQLSKKKPKSYMHRLTRLGSMEVLINTFANYLQNSDFKGMEQHLDNLEGNMAMHVVNQRLDAEVDAQIDCALPYKCFTALGYAVLENEPELVELLLKYDADTSIKPCVLNCDENSSIRDPESPLHLAALFSCIPQILLDLIDYSGSLREESMVVQIDLLKYVASCTHRDTVARILGEIADVSMVCNEMDITALHLAIEQTNIVAVEELLKQGADTNCHDRTYKTPLMVACYHKVHGHFEIVKALLEYGADVTSRDIFNRTPLHYAIRHAKAESVQLLLDAEADIRAHDCRGQTILSYIFAKVSKGFFRSRTKEDPGKLLALLIEASGGNLNIELHQDFVNTTCAFLESSHTGKLMLMLSSSALIRAFGIMN